MTTRKFVEFVTLIVLMFVLQACGAVQGYVPSINPGDVLPLATNSTLTGMRLAASGGMDTFRMAKDAVLADGSVVKDGMLMLGWAEKGCKGWGFVVMDTTTKSFLDQWRYTSAKGNFTSGRDITALTEYLKNSSGWRTIAAAELSEGIKTVIMATGGQSTWVTLASRIPVFLIVFDSPQTDPLFTVRTTQQ